MKLNKRKKQFLKQLGAFVCLLFVVVGFACDDSYSADISASTLYQANVDRYLYEGDADAILNNIPILRYEHYALFYGSSSGKFYLFNFSDEAFNIVSKLTMYNKTDECIDYFFYSYCTWTSMDGINWVGGNVSSSSTAYHLDVLDKLGSPYIDGICYQYVASDVPICVDGECIAINSVNDVYNQQLGYLQDIKFNFLYLEDDEWALVEDTAFYQFTFSNITTTNFDITQGDWLVRHYRQLEIRDLDDDSVIESYDKVFCGEYVANDLKFMFPYKGTNEAVHEACGFDGLNWWELEFLHYYMFYSDYLQLVRVGENGLEYGGFVKVWKTSNNISYSETLDIDGNVVTDGYVDKPISGSHGSGSSYEEAEHDAVKNEENRLQHEADMSDLENALSGFTSTLSVIPDVIGSVFGFLPPWCLNTCAVGFGLLIVLIIYKLARG